jgi:hypothetical protein
MSEKNEREEAKGYIKKITDFDIKGSYYDEEGKNELSKLFKKPFVPCRFVDATVV